MAMSWPTAWGGVTNVNASIENFVATYTGTYYVEITGDPGLQYSLVVTARRVHHPAPQRDLHGRVCHRHRRGPGRPRAADSPQTLWLTTGTRSMSRPASRCTCKPRRRRIKAASSRTRRRWRSASMTPTATWSPSAPSSPTAATSRSFFNAPISGEYHIEISEDPGGAGEYYLVGQYRVVSVGRDLRPGLQRPERQRQL